MHLLKPSAYRRVSLSVGVATRSQSRDCANTSERESPHLEVEWPNLQQS
jgi:hypothetical protein